MLSSSHVAESYVFHFQIWCKLDKNWRYYDVWKKCVKREKLILRKWMVKFDVEWKRTEYLIKWHGWSICVITFRKIWIPLYIVLSPAKDQQTALWLQGKATYLLREVREDILHTCPKPHTKAEAVALICLGLSPAQQLTAANCMLWLNQFTCGFMAKSQIYWGKSGQ